MPTILKNRFVNVENSAWNSWSTVTVGIARPINEIQIMNDLLSFWDGIGQPRILVVGDIILDRYTWGNAERVSPEAPVLILKADTHEVRLGGAASVAGLLRALDAHVTLAGVIGADTNGRVVRRLLEESGIDASGVLDDDSRPTTTKQRFIGRAEGKQPHQVVRVDEESDQLLSEELRNQLVNVIVNRRQEFDAVLISDYAKGVCRGSEVVRDVSEYTNGCHSGVLEAGTPQILSQTGENDLLQSVIRTANSHNIPVLIDPARRPGYACYRGATLLKPNRAEAQMAVGFTIKTHDSAMQAAETLCRELHLRAAAVTLDQDGIVLARTGKPSEFFSTNPRSICDITGAGDTAFALLGLVLADTRSKQSSCSIPESLLDNGVRLANIASGLQVERLGVAPIERREIRAEILRSDGTAFGKITTLEQLLAVSERYRRHRKSVVFTNGCFDLLHLGHVTMLEEAARLGDALIVAINGDESVRRLKGDDRPVIDQHERSRMLAALECVDHVVIFDDPTPHQLLNLLRPDVLVKGGTTGHIVGREIVESYGGRVVRTDECAGRSTTSILSHIRSTRNLERQGTQ